MIRSPPRLPVPGRDQTQFTNATRAGNDPTGLWLFHQELLQLGVLIIVHVHISLFVHFTAMAYYAYIDKLFFVIDTVHNPPVPYADSPLIC